jgi:hypothetical protein
MTQPPPSLSPELAARLASIALDGITAEYPVYSGHVLMDAADTRRPRELHPAFYGCFDWHSAVHTHWQLARLLRLFPALPAAGRISAALSDHLAEANLRAEADLMRRVLPPDEFAGWLAAFLPALAGGGPPELLAPAHVSDRSDGQIVHLDGLNLSRAWCMWGIAAALPPGDPRRSVLLDSATRHAHAGLAGVGSGDYMGDHWLGSFALYMLGCAPSA